MRRRMTCSSLGKSRDLPSAKEAFAEKARNKW